MCGWGGERGVCGWGGERDMCGEGRGVCVDGEGRGTCVDGEGRGACVDGEGRGTCVDGEGRGVCVQYLMYQYTTAGYGFLVFMTYMYTQTHTHMLRSQKLNLLVQFNKSTMLIFRKGLPLTFALGECEVFGMIGLVEETLSDDLQPSSHQS